METFCIFLKKMTPSVTQVIFQDFRGLYCQYNDLHSIQQIKNTHVELNNSFDRLTFSNQSINVNLTATDN